MRRALMLLIACALLCACSVLGLDDYEVYACEPHMPCEHLNEELGDQCMQYACSASGRGCEMAPYDGDRDGHPSRSLCAGQAGLEALDCDDADYDRRPGFAEEYDGRDNDCDTLIDEGTIPDELFAEADLEEGVEQLAFTASGDDAPLIAITRRDETTFTTSSYRVLEYAIEGPQSFAFNDMIGDNCAGVNGVPVVPCRIGQLALGASGDTLLGLGVQRAGCTTGQLRAGAGSVDDATLSLAEPPSEDGSNIPFGVDLDPNEPLCTLSGDCPGAKDSVIAVLGGAQEQQALSAWLAPAAGACDEACCPGVFQVMALGLFAGTARGRAYVSGSASGMSERIGESDATGAPAITAFESNASDSGYVLAYPATDRIELRFVPRLDRGSVTKNHVVARIGADGTRHVALPERLLMTDDPKVPRGLAAAFVAEDGRTLRFSALELHRDADELTVVGEPITLVADAEIRSRPVLAYAPDGFVSEEANGPHGGWVVIWLETNGSARVLRALRIAEADLRVLGEPIELASGDVAHPFTFLKQAAGQRSSVRYGFIHNDTLRVTRITRDMDN